MRAVQAKESFLVMPFPTNGIDRSISFTSQRKGTTPTGTNVRVRDPLTGRERGAQRPSLARYIDAKPNGTNLIQDLNVVVGVGYSAPGGTGQSSDSGRVVTLVAVSAGNVVIADSGGTAWHNPTNYSAALNATGRVFSTSLNQKLWFADGTNWKYYDPSTDTVTAWVASAGSLPVDSAGNTPRLIETWRGRLVLSGLSKDPQNWFMSKVGDATDYDYSPLSPTPTQAIAGNNSPLGLVGDVITGIVPYTDDLLIFGTDHQLWMLAGDPFQGGQLYMISDGIGMAWGRAWCRDPVGNIYFFGNRPGIYQMAPGNQPTPIAQAIRRNLQQINTGAYGVRMVWDERMDGMHVFVTKTSAAAATTHFFFEQRTGAWWEDEFANNNHNPLACCIIDGNEVDDRVALLGSWDGYVRFLSNGAGRDDGTDVDSSIVIGPLQTENADDLLLKDLQAIMAEDAGDVTYSIYVGRTAESALASNPVATGTWTAGRNLVSFIRRSGYAIWVKIEATNYWALETIKVRLGGKGKVRARGR